MTISQSMVGVVLIIHNMSNFREVFSPVTTVLLKDNYRSTQNILDMANTVIEDGNNRLMQKVLEGNNGVGDKVNIIKCTSESYRVVLWRRRSRIACARTEL